MTALVSSVLTRAEYDDRAHMLALWFKETGHRYDYLRVPPNVYEALMSASSHGSYFARHIRDRYEFRRVWNSPFKRFAR
ncbi:MAG: KTSC domain-containing protein [Caulobacterales bacterium]